MDRSILSIVAALIAGVASWFILSGMTGPYVSNFGALLHWTIVIATAIFAGALLYYRTWRTHVPVIGVLLLARFLAPMLEQDVTPLAQVLVSAAAIAFIVGWFARPNGSVAPAH